MSAPKHPTTPNQPITRADIEAKLGEIGGEVSDQAANTKRLAVTTGAIVVAVVFAGVFLLGRRRGKKLSTIVEIRRV